ncbi:LacI family DNA-binding transcriptional regulator [Silvibacterium dinghuense]|uniref:LacI family transcriptional regulator n=1 Tax=Silvibacterium dinghuense TaxID=1560006 RepID=A0A4Q1SBT6_9BACT|nr:LacI family DNA-binding transcriptional regulator [Silvibacterium dinghuense]RXS94290.1 LacI family transcriptional regulator [Silvibacterium dinghuense]GGH17172.1 transcriptional regulator [Silvibacterium dinghuense]
MATNKKSGKAAGIKDIADALGTSIGTVDRALHGRSGVSERTKARVLRMAEQLGYKPNIAARSLKLNRSIRIAAVLPREIAAFFDPLRSGIQAAADEAIGMRVTLDFIDYPRLGCGDQAALESAAAKKYDGILFTPGRPRELAPVIRKIVGQGVPMICVASDAPDSGRVSSVTVDAYTSGALAAELLSHRLQTPSRVATITGELATFDHAEKLRGFAATLAMLAPHLTLLPVVESHELPEDAYRQSTNLLKSKNRPDALYISTANSLPVLRALEELKLLGKVQVVATDLFQELVPLLESGQVLATLYQRPEAQGKMAFEALLGHLANREKPLKVHRFAPHIILRSNLPLFIDRLTESE